MNVKHMVLSALLIAATTTAQDKLSASSVFSSSGLVCDPWSCVPTTMSALRGYRLGLTVAGSVWQPRVVLIGIPQAICLPIPGIAGALQIQQPDVLYLPMTWGRMYVSGLPGQTVCGGWLGFGHLSWPTTIPPGFRAVIQTLSFTSDPAGYALLSFSNAVEVTAM